MLVHRLLAVISRVCRINYRNTRLQPEMSSDEAHLTILGYVGYNALGRMFSAFVNQRLCPILRTVMTTVFTLNTRSE